MNTGDFINVLLKNFTFFPTQKKGMKYKKNICLIFDTIYAYLSKTMNKKKTIILYWLIGIFCLFNKKCHLTDLMNSVKPIIETNNKYYK